MTVPFFFSSGTRVAFLELVCPAVVSLMSTHKITSNVPVKTKQCFYGPSQIWHYCTTVHHSRHLLFYECFPSLIKLVLHWLKIFHVLK